MRALRDSDNSVFGRGGEREEPPRKGHQAALQFAIDTVANDVEDAALLARRVNPVETADLPARLASAIRCVAGHCRPTRFIRVLSIICRVAVLQRPCCIVLKYFRRPAVGVRV
jgi:hypothetical protein